MFKNKGYLKNRVSAIRDVINTLEDKDLKATFKNNLENTVIKFKNDSNIDDLLRILHMIEIDLVSLFSKDDKEV